MTASTRTATADALLAGFDADLYVTDPDIITSYARDRTGAYVGIPLAVARPRSAQELSAIMIRCAELGVGVVPQGGLTGLVGAAVSDPDQPELVVLLDRMNAIRLIDTVGFAMVVEAGCVLETAKQAAEEQDCLLPITFGAQGSCRIGGNVATNAGGFNVLRYGMTRDLVLGLEVVLPDGRIWNGLRTLRKDNRGYDLKQLFIGARRYARHCHRSGAEALSQADPGRDRAGRPADGRGRDGALRHGTAQLQRPAFRLRDHVAAWAGAGTRPPSRTH